MQRVLVEQLAEWFARQHGVIGRSEARTLGVDFHTERRRVKSGEWACAGRHVIRLTTAPVTHEQRLIAACIEAGPHSVASHQSAAWLWGLIDPPARHAVTIPRDGHATVAWAVVHRPKEPPDTVVIRSGIRCTGLTRTLVDLAGVVDGTLLDEAVDRALARRLVTVAELTAQIELLARPGRTGIGPLRRALRRRGYVGAPNPSVLESRALRLLHLSGIRPLAAEVCTGPGGRYRVDILVARGVVAEVDGFAYHHTPEQKQEDERRRSRLRLEGWFVLVFDWRDVTHNGQRVVAEIREALRQTQLSARRRGA